MSKLYVTEYSRAATEENGQAVPVGLEPGLDDAPIDFSGGAAGSTLKANTRFVRVHCDAICSIVFAASGAPAPTANTNNKRLASGQTEFFGVQAGGTQLSVVTNT